MTRAIRQAYDPVKEMFLPDRFIRGECPRCGAQDQYGDSCEVCGATYSPTDLKNPVSALSGATPVERATEHDFVRLADFEPMLREWTGLAGRTINDVLWGRRDIRFDNLALIAEVLKRPVKDFFEE